MLWPQWLLGFPASPVRRVPTPLLEGGRDERSERQGDWPRAPAGRRQSWDWKPQTRGFSVCVRIGEQRRVLHHPNPSALQPCPCPQPEPPAGPGWQLAGVPGQGDAARSLLSSTWLQEAAAQGRGDGVWPRGLAQGGGRGFEGPTGVSTPIRGADAGSGACWETTGPGPGWGPGRPTHDPFLWDWKEEGGTPMRSGEERTDSPGTR